MPGRPAAGTVQHRQYETPSQHQAPAAAGLYDPACEDHLNRHDAISRPGPYMAAGFAALAWSDTAGRAVTCRSSRSVRQLTGTKDRPQPSLTAALRACCDPLVCRAVWPPRDLRRDAGLIVPGLASRPRITVYWDGMLI